MSNSSNRLSNRGSFRFTWPALPAAVRRRQALVQCGTALAIAWAVTGPVQAQDVGVISFAIGQGSVLRAGGGATPTERGVRIHVGDRIETTSSGQVHIRFVDDGAVSVRPDSVLVVQDYVYDPTRPDLSEVRLKLDKGVGRSISGGATEQDKSRFRLNTPIAAIGVRGTDFIVQAEPGAVRATVAAGAIVVAPYGQGCSLTALGPCEGGWAKELSAEMGQWMAEVRSGDAATRLVRAPQSGGAVNKSNGSGDGGGFGTDREIATLRASGLLAAEPTLTEAQRGNDRAAADVLSLAAISVPQLNSPPPLTASLVWGRWAIYPEAGDNVTVPFALARVDRLVTVADYGAGLFRTNASLDWNQLANTNGGIVEFRIDHAAVTYESAAGVVDASVKAANLTVDFGRRTFATALDLSTSAGVTGQVRASGPIRADGLFVAVDATQRVAGALSGDAREAGYLFETLHGSDVFRGRTLWGRRP